MSDPRIGQALTSRRFQADSQPIGRHPSRELLMRSSPATTMERIPSRRQGDALITDRTALAKELAFLRKGRATLHPGLAHLMGPQLRRLCQVSADDAAHAVRGKL